MADSLAFGRSMMNSSTLGIVHEVNRSRYIIQGDELSDSHKAWVPEFETD